MSKTANASRIVDNATHGLHTLVQDFVGHPASSDDGSAGKDAAQGAADEETTPWHQPFPREPLFFRLRRRQTASNSRFRTNKSNSTFAVDDCVLDLAVDTNSGLGLQPWNRVDIVFTGSRGWRSRVLARLLVCPYAPKTGPEPKLEDGEAKAIPNVAGSLFIDFGNSAHGIVFAQEGKDSSTRWELMELACSFTHPRHKIGPILKASTLALHVPTDPTDRPLLALGESADLLIHQHPHVSYVASPKKNVRDWSREQHGQQTSMPLQGVVGSRPKLLTMSKHLEFALTELLMTAVATFANRKQTFISSNHRVAQCHRILLTHPLTWRYCDKEAFRKLVDSIAARIFVLPQFRRPIVEFVCSEPVAVAAYVIWESLIRFGTSNNGNFELAKRNLGLTDGTDSLRLLIFDIGGGSTDVSVLEAHISRATDSTLEDDRGSRPFGNASLSVAGDCRVSMEELETLRFNCAGDRISHFLAVAILEYLREKYNFQDNLDLFDEGQVTRANRNQKRQILSHVSRLADAAKPAISETGTWELSQGDEARLVPPDLGLKAVPGMENLRLNISHEILKEWMLQDTCVALPTGRAGFADVLSRIGEVVTALRSRDKTPHLIVLSGRTSRLPFIRAAIIKQTGLPAHKVKTLAETIPQSTDLSESDDYAASGNREIEKLAVVIGAHRLRCGGSVTFNMVRNDQTFHRNIGIVAETKNGTRLREKYIICSPGESAPKTTHITLPKQASVKIGWAFDKNSIAEIIGTISNDQQSEQKISVTIHDDLTIDVKGDNVTYVDWVPGGEDLIADNFNDTGRIDQESPHSGFIRSIIRRNREHWIIHGSSRSGGFGETNA